MVLGEGCAIKNNYAHFKSINNNYRFVAYSCPLPSRLIKLVTSIVLIIDEIVIRIRNGG